MRGGVDIQRHTADPFRVATTDTVPLHVQVQYVLYREQNERSAQLASHLFKRDILLRSIGIVASIYYELNSLVQERYTAALNKVLVLQCEGREFESHQVAIFRKTQKIVH